MKVAFLGLGVMGYRMAGHLARAGHDVTVYNRTAAKAAAWCAENAGRSAATPAEAAAAATVIFSCVGNDDDVRAVTLAPQGAFHGMARGAILVDHTTASAELARELDTKARAAGLGFLDAPVSGGEAGAIAGRLTVFAGGGQEAFEVVEPLLGAYARMATLMGPAGSGQLTKMVNQILLAGLLQGLAEGLNFAVRAGLDAKKAAEVISKGAAQSWQLENRSATMVDGKFGFGFAVDWMRKDLGICLAEGRRNDSSMPVAALVDQLYQRVQARDGGRWDTSSLIDLLAKP